MGVLRRWYQRADASFVGGGLKGRGCHDLLEPLCEDLRPLCFLERGDPGGVGEALAKLGLALPLQPGAALENLADLAMEKVPGAYQQLKQERDGRERTLDFLVARGALPQ